MFETPVHLRQVQFLSHQSKIATKIELFTALPPEGQSARYENAQFKRLGYLSLDCNERSQFQARELKSVYVDVSAQFLRIVLHKCHVNRHNIVNQVGLIALHCSGEVLGPDLTVGPPPPNPTLARGPDPQAQAPVQSQARSQQPGPAAVPAASPPPVAVEKAAPPPVAAGAGAGANSEQAQDAAQAAVDEMRYDSRTLERIRALTTAKQRAVEAEDYEEAKRCKEMLGRLRQTGLLLRELEDRKRAAVANEDYDAAKALKVEIDKLRNAIERPHVPSGGTTSRASPVDQAMLEPDAVKAPPMSPPVAHQVTAPRGAHQPVMAQAPMYAGGYDDHRAHSQGRAGSAMPEAGSPLGSPMNHDPVPPMFGAGPGGPGSGPAGGAVSPTMHQYQDEPPSMGPGPPAAFDGGMNARGASPPLMGGSSAPKSPGMQGPMGGPPQPQGLERERSGASEAAYHLRGVPNVEDLGAPEALPANADKEVDLLLNLFGDFVTRCIYSKTWNLRDAALQKLALDLREGARGRDDPGQLLQAYATILKRGAKDTNVQAFNSAANLVQAVCAQLLESGKVRRGDAQAMLDPMMPLLVERLGDANARVQQTARDAMLDLARCLGAQFATQYVLQEPKKKVHARVYSSRLLVLNAMASEFGVQPESRDGVPLEATMQLAMKWFNNPDGGVRENAIKLAGACYMHVGLRRIEGYLASLRPAQRELFDAEFERATNAGRDQAPVGGRQQASARPAPPLDDGYGGYDDGSGAGGGYGGLPPPQVAPPRQGGNASGQGRGQAGYGAGAPPQLMEEPMDAEEELDDFTCQFCGRYDPSFTPEALDVHYWRECPMLIQCEFCQQVIEISTLKAHLCEECEEGQPAQQKGYSMDDYSCPLCRTDLGAAEDQDWRHHLLSVGCPNNPRSNVRGGQPRGYR